MRTKKLRSPGYEHGLRAVRLKQPGAPGKRSGCVILKGWKLHRSVSLSTFTGSVVALKPTAFATALAIATSTPDT